tara:strand:+ start:766 stop:1257 length:492 start_codon:yes stop_codon:yes gene_type:complete
MRKRRKKAQVDQVMVYALVAVIVVIIVLFGYKAIKGMKQKAEIAGSVQLETKLRSDIESMGKGSIVVETYHIPAKYRGICFLDYEVDAFLSGPSAASPDPVVNNAYYDKVKENVYLISDGPPESYYIHTLRLVKPIECIDVQGKFKLKLEGKGATTVVTYEKA